MSSNVTRPASDAEVDELAFLSEPFVDALQLLNANKAMNVLTYVAAQCILNIEVQPGFSQIEAFDHWAQAVRTTIERTAAQRQARAH